MRCLSVVVLALVPAASSQAVQGMQMRSWSFSSFGGWSSTRSSSSSVAWGLGSDGQMHQEVHQRETSKTYDQDASVQKELHSKMTCVDGLCHEQTVGKFGRPATPPAAPTRMQRVLDLMGFVRSSPSLRGPAGGAQAHAAVLILPRSVPAVAPAVAPAEVAPATVAPPVPQHLLRGPLRQASAEIPPMQLAAALFAGSLLLAGVVSTMLKFYGQRSQAREVPLRSALAEPLAASAAPGPSAAAMPASKAETTKNASVTAREAAKTYLACLYSEVAMPTRVYLQRVYAKALA